VKQPITPSTEHVNAVLNISETCIPGQLALMTVGLSNFPSPSNASTVTFQTDRDAFFQIYIPVWNKEKLPDQWKEYIIIPIHKKDDKTDCNNYRGISLLSTSYKILSNILLSRLVPYVD
jgi:hypothetical protein